MTYCNAFHPDNLTEAIETCKEFVEAVKLYKPALLQKPKFHLLLHLPQNMLEFGPTSSFNTERSVL